MSSNPRRSNKNGGRGRHSARGGQQKRQDSGELLRDEVSQLASHCVSVLKEVGMIYSSFASQSHITL